MVGAVPIILNIIPCTSYMLGHIGTNIFMNKEIGGRR